MKVAVLLSAGRHPVSGAPVLPRVEAQAIRLGAELGDLTGLHAGPSAEAVADALGRGLGTLIHLKSVADPVPALAAALLALEADVVLAGARSQGQDETGLVPYLLAEALGVPLVADAAAVTRGERRDTIVVEQALAKGARRRIVLRTPCVVTVHRNAPPPRPFAYAQARRGMLTVVDRPDVHDDVSLCPLDLEERAYRARPKMMRGAPNGGSAADRLKAATGATGSATTNVMVGPSPEAAAQAILAHLRGIGVLPAAKREAI